MLDILTGLDMMLEVFVGPIQNMIWVDYSSSMSAELSSSEELFSDLCENRERSPMSSTSQLCVDDHVELIIRSFEILFEWP